MVSTILLPRRKRNVREDGLEDPELLEDFFLERFGVSARTRASPCSNVAECVGMLLQPWFSGEEVVRPCRVVRGTATS